MGAPTLYSEEGALDFASLNSEQLKYTCTKGPYNFFCCFEWRKLNLQWTWDIRGL